MYLQISVTIIQNDLLDQFLTSPQNCSIRAPTDFLLFIKWLTLQVLRVAVEHPYTPNLKKYLIQYKIFGLDGT